MVFRYMQRMWKQVSGASGGIRTHDPCLRRAVLYPAELRMRYEGDMIRMSGRDVHALLRVRVSKQNQRVGFVASLTVYFFYNAVCVVFIEHILRLC